MTEDKENHNGTLGQLKAVREKMKKQWIPNLSTSLNV